jgi:mannitol/fructose-specific phosphotransferase system IIA component (Ntr-type)
MSYLHTAISCKRRNNMRITDLLDRRSIDLNGAPKKKSEALDQMVELMAKSEKIRDLDAYRAEVYHREEVMDVYGRLDR